MLYTKSFIRTRRETPHGVTSINQALLERGSFISQLGSGIFTYLPLGLKVFKKLEKIILKKLEELGAQQVFLTSLHPAEIWQQSGRFDEIGDELVKLSLNKKDDFVLAMTHEEAITKMAISFIKTYQDLPIIVNQISKKIRNEIRPRGGLIRLKEFTMQDAYSFHATQEDLDNTFKDFTKAYEEIFKAIGLDVTKVQASSGIMGGGDSVEFMLVTPSGEDHIFICPKCHRAFSMEAAPKEKICPDDGEELKEEKAIELGHIFKLGSKYSEKLNLKFTDKDGQENFVLMGCYGIGIDRLIGAAVEKCHDDKGICWPKSIAPVDVYLIDLEGSKGEGIYKELTDAGLEVLFDDRETAAGVKFADADLLGIPYRIVISEKTLEENGVEIKERGEKESRVIPIDNVTSELRK